MSKYRITIEGKTYEMEVELIPDGTPAPQKISNTFVEKKDQDKKADTVTKQQTTANIPQKKMGIVTAPIPGTIVRIDKGIGAEVKAGETVLILEAMKMENEIVAPVDGTISVINCKPGDTVAGGEILFEVE